MTVRILTGDARAVLASLPSESVNCCVTSPPYFGLRSYLPDGHPDKPKEIGLEPTPDAFVAEMVAVFREVRRVLRRDGTLWLNLGDSYAQNEIRHRQGQEGSTLRDGAIKADEAWANGTAQTGRRVKHGLKPKDLMMIPARVAMALQAPYYAGVIKSEADRRWLAAMIDAEGCIYVSRSKAGATTGRGRQYVRTQDAFDVGVSVAQRQPAILYECARIFGRGNVRKADEAHWDWRVFSGNARDLLREVYPYLIAKQQEARIALGAPPSGADGTAAWEALKIIHKGGETTVDFPPPESMFEPGWYLRQDVIWSKPNPMPESVTDRCTKAHEYMFLLTKAGTYWYDADAIRLEPTGRTDAITSFGNVKDRPIKGGRDKKGGGSELDGLVGANKRSVWEVATAPFSEAHFATFPPDLIKPCIKAGCPSGGTVLDPFGGAGTTGLVADRLGRSAILIELNESYARMAKRRIETDGGMFGRVDLVPAEQMQSHLPDRETEASSRECSGPSPPLEAGVANV